MPIAGVRPKTTMVKFEFVRSSGPGRQNVNRVATSVQLRFDLHFSGLQKKTRSQDVAWIGCETDAFHIQGNDVI